MIIFAYNYKGHQPSLRKCQKLVFGLLRNYGSAVLIVDKRKKKHLVSSKANTLAIFSHPLGNNSSGGVNLTKKIINIAHQFCSIGPNWNSMARSMLAWLEWVDQ